jgi:hypothetical protein
MLLALVALPTLGIAPAAEATGAAVCTITGTINFSTSAAVPTEGRWRIEPAVIDCRGLFRGWERIVAPGAFTGSGSYTALPTGSGSCLNNAGSGTVDYRISTSETDVHITEPHSFVLPGPGVFSTPTLRGTFQVTPPNDGNCVTKPVTKALFLAEASMVRFRSPSDH